VKSAIGAPAPFGRDMSIVHAALGFWVTNNKHSPITSPRSTQPQSL